MKTVLIFFRCSKNQFDGQYYSQIINAFKNDGFPVTSVEILEDCDDIAFKRRFDEFTDLADNIVIFGGETVSFDIKGIIADSMDSALVENENAKMFFDAVCKNDGVNYPESYAYLPMEATVVPNIHGAFQGFIMDSNQLTVSLLPAPINQVKIMCEKYLLPYLENKLGVKRNRLVLKYFGEKDILVKTLKEAENIGVNEFSYSIKEQFGDVTIDILFEDNSDKDVRGEITRYIVSNLKDNIYAEFETTLGERLFDVLKLKGLRLSVAESFTGGRVVSAVIANSGASSFVNEGVVSYSNQSKIKRLGVSEKDLQTHGAVSSVVAYQMAAGLLRSEDTDVAIATTGIAGPKSDDTKKPVGLCYVAVGTKNGVYAYRLNLSGSREEITETAKNSALFLAIKNLK